MAGAALPRPMGAQSNTGTLAGTVVDPKMQAIAGANVAVRGEGKAGQFQATSNSRGEFKISGIPSGSYTVEVTAPGFALISRDHVSVGTDETPALQFALSLASVAEEITVSADVEDVTSQSAQLSPIKALLDTGSARTEIPNNYIRNYASPVADYTEIVQVVPGTFSINSNGVGLGQGQLTFRGFIDGEFTISYDGIPFEDTNDPTHHSWVFFPGNTIGGVDFDRSPGTASDIGPTNYGGSIHLLSPQLQTDEGFRANESYGSFNTNLFDFQYNSGLFGAAKKANFWFEGSHLTSDGFQTNDFQIRTAGALKYTYKLSDKTYLSAFSSVVILDNNTPDTNTPTRGQVAEYGYNFLLASNPTNPDGSPNALYYKDQFYHVPTDFSYLGLTTDLGHSWKLDGKAYVYSYYNHQHYVRSTQSTADTTTGGSGLVDPNNPVAGSGYQTFSAGSIAKDGVDKENAYNRIGGIVTASSASRFGVFRTGYWYEYSYTNRYQINSNPLTWVDQPGVAGVRLHESFITNSIQPFAEYQLVAIPKFIITAGIKDAYYNQGITQFDDNGHIVGTLTNGALSEYHNAGYNSWLPSVEVNYRVRNNWSVYGQYGRGSNIPPSSVFDVSAANPVSVIPKPTVGSTYQGGTVVKFNRASFDLDGYFVHFQNNYAAVPQTNTAGTFTQYVTSPDSRTRGFEGEGNFLVTRGLSIFLNGTITSAQYVATATTPVGEIAGSPHDTEQEGITYQDKQWEAGFFNKRVGTQFNDNSGSAAGVIHSAIPIDAFSIANLFINYNFSKFGRFGQSKLRLSLNNLLDDRSIVGVAAANAGTYANPYTINPGDDLTLTPGRSVTVSFQFGFAPKER
ncbi:MAG TPA: TonB-dependent receptor [Terracidiphilus sp.]|nr:TonB-dependent receptor [Terracidiphilus sp.]